MNTATVTVQREAPGGTFDITVALTFNEDFGWSVTDSLDEDGGWISLTPDESNLAISLAEDGVDETGR